MTHRTSWIQTDIVKLDCFPRHPITVDNISKLQRGSLFETKERTRAGTWVNNVLLVTGDVEILWAGEKTIAGLTIEVMNHDGIIKQRDYLLDEIQLIDNEAKTHEDRQE